MPQQFANNRLGTPFIELDSVDSTNNYALEQVHAGLAQHGFTVFAHEQLSGKGQRGKTWVTAKGSNVILTIVIDPFPLQISQQFQLIATTALAVREIFASRAGDDVKIKWPNDLYWQDRKAGGILIESGVGGRESGGGSQESRVERESEGESEGESGRESGGGSMESGGAWKWAVVGIGLNINQTQFPGTLINPVSLKQITGKNFDCIGLSKDICSRLDDYLAKLKNEGFDEIYQTYLTHLYKNGERVKLKKENRVFEGLIKGVTPDGELIVQHSIEENFSFGETEWKI